MSRHSPSPGDGRWPAGTAEPVTSRCRVHDGGRSGFIPGVAAGYVGIVNVARAWPLSPPVATSTATVQVPGTQVPPAWGMTSIR